MKTPSKPFKWLRKILEMAFVTLMLCTITSCGTDAQQPLTPAVDMPKTLILKETSYVKVPFVSEGAVTMPAGAYQLLGRNDLGVFYRPPAPLKEYSSVLGHIQRMSAGLVVLPGGGPKKRTQAPMAAVVKMMDGQGTQGKIPLLFVPGMPDSANICVAEGYWWGHPKVPNRPERFSKLTPRLILAVP